MRVLYLAAALCAALVSQAAAQAPAPAAPPAAPAPVKLTPKEIAALHAKLSSLDRQMGQEWASHSAVNLPGLTQAQVNERVGYMVKEGRLVVMRPISPKHEALQIERAAVEAQLLAAGQKVRNMSLHAQQQYGVK